jgi:hypothetical protein
LESPGKQSGGWAHHEPPTRVRLNPYWDARRAQFEIQFVEFLHTTQANFNYDSNASVSWLEKHD